MQMFEAWRSADVTSQYLSSIVYVCGCVLGVGGGVGVSVHVYTDKRHIALLGQNHLKPVLSLLEAWCGSTAATNPSPSCH